jgi:hypothetical protein
MALPTSQWDKGILASTRNLIVSTTAAATLKKKKKVYDVKDFFCNYITTG